MSKKEENLTRYNQSFEKFFPEYFFFFHLTLLPGVWPFEATQKGLMDYEKVKQH